MASDRQGISDPRTGVGKRKKMSPSDLRRAARRMANATADLQTQSRERMDSADWGAWQDPDEVSAGTLKITKTRRTIAAIRREVADQPGAVVPNHDEGDRGPVRALSAERNHQR